MKCFILLPLEKVTNHSRSQTVKPKGSFLVHLRRGRRQRDVEEGAGLPLLRLSLYERGNPIPMEHLEKLALYYEMPARELVEPESLTETLARIDNSCRVLGHSTNGKA